MVKRSRDDSPSSASGSASPRLGSILSAEHTLVTEDTGHHSTKYAQLDKEVENPSAPTVMRCFLPPHPQGMTFSSYEEYDVHYAKMHVNRCSDCRKNFPTEHYLGLHIEENHDPLNEARRARGEKTYGCFVENCDRKCSNPQKRRMHLIDKHMFPKNYDFFIINDGIDKRSSLLRSKPGAHRRSSAATKAAQIDQRTRRRSSNAAVANSVALNTETATTQDITGNACEEVEGPQSDSPNPDKGLTGQHQFTLNSKDVQRTSESRKTSADPLDEEMADLTTSLSTLKFIPSSVKFGRGKGGGGLSKR
ncbi:MAG: hypothetical protein M1812_002262 [Candelaria pacifica]|nr:MAG: hypothetical protein M1812_002262 [Candelaria pacifica]